MRYKAETSEASLALSSAVYLSLAIYFVLSFDIENELDKMTLYGVFLCAVVLCLNEFVSYRVVLFYLRFYLLQMSYS